MTASIAKPLFWGRVETSTQNHWEAVSSIEGRFVVTVPDHNVLWKRGGITTWLNEDHQPSVEAAKACAQLWEDDLMAERMSDLTLKTLQTEFTIQNSEPWPWETPKPRFDLLLEIVEHHLTSRAPTPRANSTFRNLS